MKIQPRFKIQYPMKNRNEVNDCNEFTNYTAK
jgi:hypothetical protein